MSPPGGTDRPTGSQRNAPVDSVSPEAEVAITPTEGPVRATMARWRLWLLAWMHRHEYPEWQALGLPADRVHVVDLTVEVQPESEHDGHGAGATAFNGLHDPPTAQQQDPA